MPTTSPTSTRPRVLIKQPLTLRSSTRASFLPDNPSQRAGRLMATRSSERRFMVIASFPFGYLSADDKGERPRTKLYDRVFARASVFRNRVREHYFRVRTN